MTRRRLVLAAAVAGIAAALGLSMAAGSQQRLPAAVAGVAPAPLIPVGAPARQDPDPPVGTTPPLGRGSQPGIASTAHIAVTAPDPTGGPTWAVRSYERASHDGTRRVWCTQLGRIVDGRFV